MLVGGGVLDDRGGMDTGLGGERAVAHIGGVAVAGAIEDFIEAARHAGEMGELVVGDADLEVFGIFRLELEVADQRDQIGVAAAFAEAVERALDVASAGPY